MGLALSRTLRVLSVHGPATDRHRDEYVLAPQCDDVRRVVLLLDLSGHLPTLEPSKLETIQVAHELVHQLWRCRGCRFDTVGLELFENLRMIGVRQRRQASVMDESR